MLELDFISRNKKSVEDYLSEEYFVYFLLDKNEIVYVGKTVNFNQRLKHHMQSKKFDSYFLLKCESQSEIDKLEFDYIVKFEPKYNKILPQSDRYLSVNKLKDRFKIGAWDFKRFVKQKGIKHLVCLAGTSYYDIEDFKELEE